MKKRKGEVVGQEGNILKKAKVSDFTEAEENNNNKHIQLVRTVKVLLQKEQTRLSGMLKFYIQFISCCFEIHVWDWNCNFVSQMICKSCIPAVQKLDSPIHWIIASPQTSVGVRLLSRIHFSPTWGRNECVTTTEPQRTSAGRLTG